MRQILAFGLALGAFSLAAMAGTFTGTLMDAMCKDQNPVAHTRKCAIGCAKSGLGLVTAGGKFLKFDPAGNEKALAALKASKKENDLKARVTGTLEGETLKVESIQIQ